MAVFNAAPHLPECLASMAEHAPDVPLIVKDGGSTDDTLEVLAKSPKPVTTLISEPDQGIYDALNQAISRAESDFVYILGADDRLLPGWAKAVAKLEDRSTLYYANVRRVSDGGVYDGPFDTAKMARTNICQQAVFYPRALFDRKQFQVAYKLQADWAFHMDCWDDPAVSFVHLPEAVCLYNDREGSSGRGYDKTFNRDYPGLLRKHFSFPLFLRYGIPAFLAHHSRPLRGRP